VKKYLCENCDYTFDTLKENFPKALESVGYPPLGAPYVQVDGHLQIRAWYDQCIGMCKEVQFDKI
jgi:hypothetical protein